VADNGNDMIRLTAAHDDLEREAVKHSAPISPNFQANRLPRQRRQTADIRDRADCFYLELALMPSVRLWRLITASGFYPVLLLVLLNRRQQEVGIVDCDVPAGVHGQCRVPQRLSFRTRAASYVAPSARSYIVQSTAKDRTSQRKGPRKYH
jgi:hypothetical protein